MRLAPLTTTAGAGVLILLLAATPPASGAATATAAAATYDVATYAYDAQRTGKNALETTLGTTTVGSAHPLFQAGFAQAGPMDATPIGASAVVTPSGTRNLIYVGNERGAFGALDADTGAVVWERTVGLQTSTCQDFVNGDMGVSGSAVLDRAANRVYVVGGNGRLYAFDLRSGANAPGWSTPLLITTSPQHLHSYGALNLDPVNHRIYVAFGGVCDVAPYKGQVVSVDSRTGGALRRFVVVRNSQNGGGIWGWGGVSLDSLGKVFASTGNALPNGPAEATPYGEYVLELGPYFGVLGANHPPVTGLDMDFGSTPTLIDVPGCAGRLAVENKNGRVYVYRRDNISAGPREIVPVVPPSGIGLFVGEPAYDPATRTMFIDSPTNGSLPHGMVARRFGANCTSAPLWNTAAGPDISPVSPPVIANGVVYYADGTGHTVHAFDAATGVELWHSAPDAITGDTFDAPLVFDGKIYVSSRGGAVYAFG